MWFLKEGRKEIILLRKVKRFRVKCVLRRVVLLLPEQIDRKRKGRSKDASFRCVNGNTLTSSVKSCCFATMFLFIVDLNCSRDQASPMLRQFYLFSEHDYFRLRYIYSRTHIFVLVAYHHSDCFLTVFRPLYSSVFHVPRYILLTSHSQWQWLWWVIFPHVFLGLRNNQPTKLIPLSPVSWPSHDILNNNRSLSLVTCLALDSWLHLKSSLSLSVNSCVLATLSTFLGLSDFKK